MQDSGVGLGSAKIGTDKVGVAYLMGICVGVGVGVLKGVQAEIHEKSAPIQKEKMSA